MGRPQRNWWGVLPIALVLGSLCGSGPLANPPAVSSLASLGATLFVHCRHDLGVGYIPVRRVSCLGAV